jgi:hypothetical protein
MYAFIIPIVRLVILKPKDARRQTLQSSIVQCFLISNNCSKKIKKIKNCLLS